MYFTPIYHNDRLETPHLDWKSLTLWPHPWHHPWDVGTCSCPRNCQKCSCPRQPCSFSPARLEIGTGDLRTIGETWVGGLHEIDGRSIANDVLNMCCTCWCVCVSRQICVYIIYKHIHIILWIINIYRWYFCVFSLGPTFHQKIKIFQSPELVHQSSYTDASKISLSDWCFRMSYLALSPFPVTVITRIIISLVGNP